MDVDPTPEQQHDLRIINITLTAIAICMTVVVVGTIVIIALVVTGNTTTSRLDENSTLSACRAASTARLNGARVQTDHAQNSILLGIGDDEALAVAQEGVERADRHLTEAEQQYQEEYELSNKDKSQFIEECRARGDV